MPETKTKRSPSPLILIFNRYKLLTLIAASIQEAALYSGLDANNIRRVCDGIKMSAGRYYFRRAAPEIEIEATDIGTLQLEEYDRECGVERRVYDTPQMNRIKWKYNKNKQHEKNGNTRIQ